MCIRDSLNAVRYSREAFRVYWNAVFAKMTLRPGVAEFLDELRAVGVKVAICTNMLADIQMEKLEYLGIADKVDCLVTVSYTHLHCRAHFRKKHWGI